MDLAASLLVEIEWSVTGAVDERGRRFDRSDSVSRVADITRADPAEAADRARVIVDLVSGVIPESDFQHPPGSTAGEVRFLWDGKERHGRSIEAGPSLRSGSATKRQRDRPTTHGRLSRAV